MRKSKLVKQKRRLLNISLKKLGRTPAQIKRIALRKLRNTGDYK